MFLLRNKYCANVTIIIYWDLRVSPVSWPYILDRSQVYLFACQLPTKYHTLWLTNKICLKLSLWIQSRIISCSLQCATLFKMISVTQRMRCFLTKTSISNKPFFIFWYIYVFTQWVLLQFDWTPIWTYFKLLFLNFFNTRNVWRQKKKNCGDGILLHICVWKLFVVHFMEIVENFFSY